MLQSLNAAAARLTRPIGLFSRSAPPIVIDFGCASVKVMQLSSGEQPHVTGGDDIQVPEEAREGTDALLDFYASALPSVLRSGAVKGRQVVCSLPSSQTMVQHLQITPTEGISEDELVKTQLGMQLGVAPDGVVTRTFPIREIHRDGQNRKEVICFTIPRDLIMRYVSMLEQSRLDVASVHTSTMAMVRAFDHVCKSAKDAEAATMYIDLGYSGTRVAITNDKTVVFARSIPIGGQHFDQLIAKQRETSLSEAREYRLSMADSLSPGAASKPSPPQPTTAASMNGVSEEAHAEEAGNGFARLSAAMAKERAEEAALGCEGRSDTVQAEESIATQESSQNAGLESQPLMDDSNDPAAKTPDLSELLETIADELSMCVRYYQHLFPKRSIDRAVLVGGEARQGWLCQHIVRSLRMQGRLGDPIARFVNEETMNHVGLFKSGSAYPHWTMACGLCSIQAHE